MRRIGVDTGGTFTDCVLIDYATDEVTIAKVPSEPAQPQEAIMGAVATLLAPTAGAVESVTHGTTIATNAVITGDLSRAGLITTRGFRDVLEIGTQQRARLYDLRQRPRPALIPRDLRVEVSGRIAATGEEIEPLDVDEVERAVDLLVSAGVEAIAVACLFSYVNPAHEQAIQEIARKRAPELYVGTSARVSPEPREYPRFVTAAVNAALAPRIDPYVRALESRLAGPPLDTRFLVMQSNGGIATADRSVGEGVHQLILSGPAAGVAGGARESTACGYEDCVTFDMGGTSADIGVVLGGTPRTAVEMVLPNGVPCKLPNIEIETIGAGGGSVAWIDAGGALNVGPQSAGAEPGPACYGRGGAAPTATDAHLVLGRLPHALVGGEVALDVRLASAALESLAVGLGTSVDEAAFGALAVLEANMAGAIRRAAARHGDDLRDFVLVAGGGAGPLHAASIMLELGMPAAIVPRHPGLLSALGLLAAHIRHDLSASLLGVEDEMEARFAALEREAAEALAADGVAPEDRRYERSVDMRYFGQEYAVRVPVGDGDMVQRFHELHERTFGHSAAGERTELVAARVVALGLRTMPALRPTLADAPGSCRDTRLVMFAPADGHVRTEVWDRAALAGGQVVAGPAIVEQLDATTVIPPGCVATVHETAALIITREENSSGR
jgi:N-methylhydantoinase A